MSDSDKRLVYSDTRGFYELLDINGDKVKPYLYYDHGQLLSVMLVVNFSGTLSIVSFTHPDFRGLGLQRYLLNKIKADYKGKTIYTKAKNHNAEGWKKFWLKNGFHVQEENPEFIQFEINL